MFNNSLKKEALELHKRTLERYDASYKMMSKSCEELYSVRENAITLIKFIEEIINSIANTPKSFGSKMCIIDIELMHFRKTEDYAKEAYEESIKEGKNIIGGAAAGLGIATLAPTAMLSFATTFGTATTGTAISALSGAAANKAAIAWLGRTFAGFAIKGGAGMAAGEAFLALAGPIGWGLTAVTTGYSLFSLTSKNKEIADSAVEEAKNIAKARETLDEVTEKVNALITKTNTIYNDLNSQHKRIESFMNKDYLMLTEDEQSYLGATVNNTLSLAELINKNVE